MTLPGKGIANPSSMLAAIRLAQHWPPLKLLPMAYEFKVVRRVEFSDTDMAGIVHYSNFFRYMETAEHAFFRSLGFLGRHAPGGPTGRLAKGACRVRLSAAIAI